MPILDDILTEPAARRLSVACDAATALAAEGWRVTPAATHSGGTADLAADRAWHRGRLSARVRLVIRCDSAAARLVFSSLPPAGIADRLPSYSFGEDDPPQRRALGAVFDDAVIAQ